jgi:hypothetical protein
MRAFRFLSTVLLIISLGCSPALRRDRLPFPDSKTPSASVVPETLVQGKIEYLSRILEKDNLTDQDRKIASDLLDTYRTLQRISKEAPNELACRLAIRELFRSLSLMGENYFSGSQMGSQDLTSPVTLFVRKRKAIMDSYLR